MNRGPIGAMILAWAVYAQAAPTGRISHLAKTGAGNPREMAKSIRAIPDNDYLREVEAFLRERRSSTGVAGTEAAASVSLGSELARRAKSNPAVKKELFESLEGLKGSPELKEGILRRFSLLEKEDPAAFGEYQALLRRIHASPHSNALHRSLALRKLKDPSDENIDLLIRAARAPGDAEEGEAAAAGLARISGELRRMGGDGGRLQKIALGVRPLLESRDLPSADILRASLHADPKGAKPLVLGHLRRGGLAEGHVYALSSGADEELLAGALTGSAATPPSREREMRAAFAKVLEENPGVLALLKPGSSDSEADAFLRFVRPVCGREGSAGLKGSLPGLLSHRSSAIRARAVEACVECGIDAASIRTALAGEEDPAVKEALRYHGLGN